MNCRIASFVQPIVLLVLVSLAPQLFAENWAQWRGPNANGISSEKGIATKFSQTDHVLWRAPMPGQGGATPIIWEDRIFVTSADNKDDLYLICLRTNDGKEVWRKRVTGGNRDARSGEGNSASPSPSTDGKNVWVFFSTGVLACYDFNGQEIWKFDVNDRFGKIDIQFGMASTPVLRGDHLYMQLIHGQMVPNSEIRTGKIVKLNKLTGETVWQFDRITDAKMECKQSYASPFIYDDGKVQFLIAHGADCTTGHSLENGQELWRVAGLNGPAEYNKRRFDPTFRFVASPAFTNGTIIVPTAKEGPLLALNVNDMLKGNVTGDKQVVRWVATKTPDVSIPLIVDGLVYCLQIDGRLQCYRLDTGEQVYFERTQSAQQHRASPVYADGHIYLCSKDGMVTVVKAGPKLEIVAGNDMGAPISASPAISNGVLYIRSYEALFAIK